MKKSILILICSIALFANGQNIQVNSQLKLKSNLITGIMGEYFTIISKSATVTKVEYVGDEKRKRVILEMTIELKRNSEPFDSIAWSALTFTGSINFFLLNAEGKIIHGMNCEGTLLFKDKKLNEQFTVKLNSKEYPTEFKTISYIELQSKSRVEQTNEYNFWIKKQGYATAEKEQSFLYSNTNSSKINSSTVTNQSKTDDIIPKKKARIGLVNFDIDDNLMKQKSLKNKNGIYVDIVAEGGAGYDAGINIGDVILSVDNEAVTGTTKFAEILSKHQPDDKIQVLLLRKEAQITKSVRLK